MELNRKETENFEIELERRKRSCGRLNQGEDEN